MLRYLILAIPSIALSLCGQTFDFEDGLGDWQQNGTAFQGQPYCKATTSTTFAPSTLRGSYWKGLSYPLGHHGKCFVTSLEKPLEGRGSLTSSTFPLGPTTPILSFRIGGTEDASDERLELQIRIPATGAAEWVRRVNDWSRSAGGNVLNNVAAEMPDEGYMVVYAATGHNSEQLRQEVIELPEFLKGMSARLRILDKSPAGHISIDYIRFTAETPPALNLPVWGIADYHTHPMSYMGFGGLKGIRTLWGVPGGNDDDYANPTAITMDIPHCVRGHDGGFFAEAFINGTQLLHYDGPSILHSLLFPHGRHGGPEFDDFPNHLMGAHEQMHITMIRRAYDGGLRLMVALATDNKAAQFLTGRVEHGHMDLVSDKASMEAQLAGMKRLAELNQKWMEIAYSPGDARKIILHNKLAIILGVEYDQLGELGFSSDDREPELEADYLWGLGARAVVPVHAINNKIGGPAVFIGPYNWLYDLIHRQSTDATSGEVRRTKPQYFEVTNDDSCDPGRQAHLGECVLAQLDSKLQLRAGIGRSIFNWLREGPDIFLVERQKQFETQYGNKNVRGLEPFGGRYISALMDRGMIVDTAHMSDRSVADTFAEVGKRLAIQHPGCNDFAYGSPASAICDPDAYPLIISHAHFRGQAVYNAPQDVPDYLPSEYDISNSNIEMVRRVGGVIGPFVAEPRVNQSNIPEIKDDCGNSSKNFAFSFHYASQRINTQPGNFVSHVGMSTDMTFIPMVSPRFGDHPCEGYKVIRHGKKMLKAQFPRYYQPEAQTVRVEYAGTAGADSPLEPYRMGQRVFNFNNDGLAHYGLLPDMLQDLKNLRDPDLQMLFQSAEGYLQMWEKAERLRGHVDIPR